MLKFTDFEKVNKLRKEAETLLLDVPDNKMPPSGYWLRLVEIVQEISGVNAQLCAKKMAWMNKAEILQLINDL